MNRDPIINYTSHVFQSYLKQTSFHLYPLADESSVMLSWSSSIYLKRNQNLNNSSLLKGLIQDSFLNPFFL